MNWIQVAASRRLSEVEVGVVLQHPGDCDGRWSWVGVGVGLRSVVVEIELQLELS